MVKLDYDRMLERIVELNELDCYIPLVLHNYIDQVSYFDRVSDDVAQQYYDARTQLMRVDDYNKYLTEDLIKWLEKHKEFQDIIIE